MFVDDLKAHEENHKALRDADEMIVKAHAGTKWPSELHFQIVMFLHKLSSIVQCACALEYRTTRACLSTGYEFIPPSFFLQFELALIEVKTKF